MSATASIVECVWHVSRIWLRDKRKEKPNGVAFTGLFICVRCCGRGFNPFLLIPCNPPVFLAIYRQGNQEKRDLSWVTKQVLSCNSNQICLLGKVAPGGPTQCSTRGKRTQWMTVRPGAQGWGGNQGRLLQEDFSQTEHLILPIFAWGCTF